MKVKLLIASVVVIVGFLLCSLLLSPPQEEFVGDIWRTTAVDADPPRRLLMARDLLNKGVLEGLDKEAVIALLGPPASSNYFGDYDTMYRLGGRGFLLKSPFYLAVRYENDRFQSAKILQD